MYNPTIKTDEFKDLVKLLHFAISKHDQNANYKFEREVRMPSDQNRGRMRSS